MIPMKKLIYSIFVLSICVLGLNAQSKNLEDFSYLSTNGDVKVTLRKGNPRAEYRIINGNADGLTIEIRGSELVVKTESNYKFWKKDRTKAEVTVYYNHLSGIDCSAGSRVIADETIAAERFEVESSSGSSCTVPVEAGDLKADVSSGGKITLSGKSQSAAFDASSGGNIEADELITSVSDAEVSSGASIDLFVTKELKANASSGGSIRYRGSPTRTDLNSSVAGSIKSY